MGHTVEGDRLNKMADQVEDKLLKVEAGLELIRKEQLQIRDKAESKLEEAQKKIDAIEFRLKPYVYDGKTPDDNFNNLYTDYHNWLLIRKNMITTIQTVDESLAEMELGTIAPYNDNTGKTVGATDAVDTTAELVGK